MSKTPSHKTALGYIHVQATPVGYRGGYLLLNEFGRPLEFHYTHEVVVSNQLRLLLGSSLGHELLVRSIAHPMTDRQTMPPRIIFVDSPGLLTLRRLIPAPVIAIKVSSISGFEERTSGEGSEPGYEIQTDAGFEKDAGTWEKLRRSTPASFEWCEPFERIREALNDLQDAPRLAG